MSTKRLRTFIHRFIITLAMSKAIVAVSLFCLFGDILAISVDPFHKHMIVSPYSAGEVFYSGGERQVLAPAPVSEPAALVSAPAAPVPALAPAPHFTFAASPVSGLAPAAPLTLGVPAAVAPAAPVPVAPVAPVVAKIAQFKLSYPQYAYGYSVQDFTTGDNKVAKEVREGEIVKGSYSVADPDGTKRTVNYYADPIHGFNAVVHKTQILK